MDKSLYMLLQEIESHKGGFFPASQSEEDLKAFDKKVEGMKELHRQNYIDCPDGRIRKHSRISSKYACVTPNGLTHKGYKVLEYGSYERYCEAEIKLTHPSLTIDQRNQSVNLHGNIGHATIAAHAQNFSQSVSGTNEIQTVLNQIKETLAQDSVLSEEEKSNCLVDVETVEKQLARNPPNRGFLDSILAPLGKITSIAALVDKLKGYLETLAI